MNAIERSTSSNGEKPSIESSQDRLIADFKAVVADAEALLRASANQGGEKLDEIRAKAMESIKRVNASMVDAQHAVAAKSREAARATDLYVHENPWQSIGTAAGVGLLIGFLLARR